MSSEKVEHQAREDFGLLHRRQVAAPLEHSEVSVGQEPPVLLAALDGHDAILAAPDDQGRIRHAGQKVRQTGVVHVRLPGQARRHLSVARRDLDLRRRGRSAVELVPLRDGLRVVHGHGEKLRGRIVEDVEDLARLRLGAARRRQNEPVDRARAHRCQLRRGPPSDRVAHEMRSAEPGGVDEPEVEPGEVVDAVHPVGVAGAPEARVRGRPHREALGDLRQPPGPATVAAGAVEHQQGIALPANPCVHADAADGDRLLTRLHAPYYAPAMGKTPLAVQLGEFVARLRFEELPAAVVDKAKAFVNHAVTVGLVGANNARTAAARRAVIEHGSRGRGRVGAGQGAPLWVDGARVPRAGAAFANGVAVAVNNQCDSYHMLTHPGVLIVPAGLATAEGAGRTGRELLTALVAGYEVQCRCARDFIPSTPAHGFRASPVYGILGCAATTARLVGLDAQGATHAIALAASFAGSLIEGQRTGARDADFAEAQAARSGMWAASLAAQGFQGAPTALEGDGGFYYAFTGSNKGDLAYTFTGPPRADLDEIVADLGRRWEVLDVKFKIYPTPGVNQPVVWLASEMTARHKLAADEIEHITPEMNYLETPYPSPRLPRPPAPDGSGFGRTAYMLAYTVIAGDYPGLERNVEGLDKAPSVDEVVRLTLPE